jgi:hypothetical protein
MDIFRLQEILGVFLVVAVLVGTILVLGSAIIFVQQAILRALRLAKPGAALLKARPINGTASPKGRWSMRFQSKSGFDLPR